MNSIVRYRYLILLSFSVLINLAAYLKQGTRLVNDSYRYLEYAEQIANGNFYQEHNIWYFGYCAFLALFIKLKISLDYAIFIQSLLSVVSILAFCKACEIFTQNNKKAFFSSLLYLAFIEVILWNDYILTESLFISFTCFTLFF